VNDEKKVKIGLSDWEILEGLKKETIYVPRETIN
jgi:DNA-directed RNA polymerase specialized sigma54-like protein